MARSAPCANSEAPRSRARRRGPAPIRIPAPLAFSALLILALAGCSADPPDSREARRAGERYLRDLALRRPTREVAGPAPGPSFVGGTVLRVDPPVSVSKRELALRVAAAREAAGRASVEFAHAGEETADSLWLDSQSAARRARMLGDAWDAAGMASTAADTTLRFCRMRVRLRWGGIWVGPQPVDREHVLRAVTAPRGRWVVFSLLPRDRDPADVPF